MGRDDFAAGHRQRRGREKEAPQGAGSVPGSEESVVMEDAEPFRASPSAAASEAGARDTPRKRRVTFSENEDVKIKDPEGTKLAVEDITRLPAALANIGQDDNQHIDADIPMSVIPGDAVDDMEQQTAIQRCGTHTIVHEKVTRRRTDKRIRDEFGNTGNGFCRDSRFYAG